ncbi:hypothetical protein SETIT_9G322500v2 [Setaria italica]|uniref:Uncharacterized protein n=1 Tax=Setaria italica TaxID=4555 RepID=A0A368SMY1_SETIT|nr:hypothetical protein SETIT_9G322500v2 [Setaria italica]
MFINLWIARGAPAENPRPTSTQDGPGRVLVVAGGAAGEDVDGRVGAVDVLRSGPAPVEEQHDDGDVVVEVPPVALLDGPDLLVPDLLLPHRLQLRSRRRQPSVRASDWKRRDEE